MARGKTIRYQLNEEYIFGGNRCWRCSKVMEKGQKWYCLGCRKIT